MKTLSISMTVNGANVGPHEVPEGLSMNDYLREYLNLTGTKFGCGVGACSACVVILDDADGTSSTIHTCITARRLLRRQVRSHHRGHRQGWPS